MKGRVAIVGAGPAGLAAAWALRKEGIHAVVFESLPLPGGLLASAIPPFRLPRHSIREDIDYILAHGVELRLNTHLPPEELNEAASTHDAAILACGAPDARESGIPGNRLRGVWMGIDFLRRLAFGHAPEILSPVVVIGGGNVATDAARWAVRLAGSATLVYRRDREDMPAYREEVEAAEAEGIKLLFRAQPVAFEGDSRTGVRQVRIQATAPGPVGNDGRRTYVPEGRSRPIPARTVILALGQQHSFERWTNALGVASAKTHADWRLKERIYAAGDVVTGPATIVEAVAAGIHTARRIAGEVFP